GSQREACMPIIRLSIHVAAPIERVFDLARSIDAHVASAGRSAEKAVAGRTSGLIELGESVTWEARHLGIRQRLTSRITRMERPSLFEDQMLKGAFRRIRHVHEFRVVEGGTEMIDVFDFEAPLPVLGVIAETLFLTSYMTQFLRERADWIKRMAETE